MGDYGNEKEGGGIEAEVITAGWEPINEQNSKAGRPQAKSREKDEQKIEFEMVKRRQLPPLPDH